VPLELKFADHATRDDLRKFLERLQRFGSEEVRLRTHATTVAFFGCTQAPVSLTDRVQTVLVSRAFALAEQPVDPIDLTVQGRALLDRIARLGPLGLTLELPEMQLNAAWAGVLPPLSEWEPAGEFEAQSLVQVAEEGIARVAAQLPDQPGEAVVRAVRAGVWGSEISPGVPAAAAFAAEVMGFLHQETRVRIMTTRTWTRLTSGRGHVLVRNTRA
jgi:hypothetical protein